MNIRCLEQEMNLSGGKNLVIKKSIEDHESKEGGPVEHVVVDSSGTITFKFPPPDKEYNPEDYCTPLTLLEVAQKMIVDSLGIDRSIPIIHPSEPVRAAMFLNEAIVRYKIGQN